MINKTYFYSKIGSNINQIRKDRNLTIEQFSSETNLNLTKSTLSGIENGKQQLSLYQAFLISKNLDIPFDIIFRDVEKEDSDNFKLLKPDIEQIENL